MKFQTLFALIVLGFLLVVSCNNDDDGPSEVDLTTQNSYDDLAIITFLESNYFQAGTGKVIAFDDEDDSDDDETPLLDLAVEDDMGYWYVKNPEVTATGPTVTDTNSEKLLLHYNMYYYIASKGADDEGNDVYNYIPLYTLSSTLNNQGLPLWDNIFFRFDLDEDSTVTEDYYEMEGFKDAITHFQATQNDPIDIPVFQGVIIIPSRLAYGRDTNVYGLRNASIVCNFELYDIEEDE